MAWVWVIVERDKSEEHLFGQTDEEKNESFIPVFDGKEDALMVLGRMAKRKERYYQVQAIRFGEVAKVALENGFSLFFLGQDGEILDRFSPSH